MLLDAATKMEKESVDSEPTAADPARWPIWLVGNVSRRLEHHKSAERVVAAAADSSKPTHDPSALYEDVRSAPPHHPRRQAVP